jgi:hypothetical protein
MQNHSSTPVLQQLTIAAKSQLYKDLRNEPGKKRKSRSKAKESKHRRKQARQGAVWASSNGAQLIAVSIAFGISLVILLIAFAAAEF